MEDRRISKDMFIQDVEGLDKKSKQSKVTKNKKIIINIIISLICLIALGLIFYFIFKKYSKEEEEENILYNPIPPEEDLDFTEEAHRSFSREVATQTMVLAQITMYYL